MSAMIYKLIEAIYNIHIAKFNIIDNKNNIVNIYIA